MNRIRKISNLFKNAPSKEQDDFLDLGPSKAEKLRKVKHSKSMPLRSNKPTFRGGQPVPKGTNIVYPYIPQRAVHIAMPPRDSSSTSDSVNPSFDLLPPPSLKLQKYQEESMRFLREGSKEGDQRHTPSLAPRGLPLVNTQQNVGYRKPYPSDRNDTRLPSPTPPKPPPKPVSRNRLAKAEEALVRGAVSAYADAMPTYSAAIGPATVQRQPKTKPIRRAASSGDIVFQTQHQEAARIHGSPANYRPVHPPPTPPKVPLKDPLAQSSRTVTPARVPTATPPRGRLQTSNNIANADPVGNGSTSRPQKRRYYDPLYFSPPSDPLPGAVNLRQFPTMINPSDPLSGRIQPSSQNPKHIAAEDSKSHNQTTRSRHPRNNHLHTHPATQQLNGSLPLPALQRTMAAHNVTIVKQAPTPSTIPFSPFKPLPNTAHQAHSNLVSVDAAQRKSCYAEVIAVEGMSYEDTLALALNEPECVIPVPRLPRDLAREKMERKSTTNVRSQAHGHRTQDTSAKRSRSKPRTRT